MSDAQSTITPPPPLTLHPPLPPWLQVDSSPAVAPAAPPAQPSETAAEAPPASPLLPAAPAAPPAPMTYASLAKSWATVAADSGVVATAPPASASPSGNGVAASNGGGGGWGAPDAAPAVGGAGLTIEQPLGQPGSSGGQHGSRPTSATGKVGAVRCWLAGLLCRGRGALRWELTLTWVRRPWGQG